MIQCLDTIHSKSSFSAANCKAKKYKQMFPDLVIRKQYQLKTDKLEYMVRFGIDPCIKRIVCSELK